MKANGLPALSRSCPRQPLYQTLQWPAKERQGGVNTDGMSVGNAHSRQLMICNVDSPAGTSLSMRHPVGHPCKSFNPPLPGAWVQPQHPSQSSTFQVSAPNAWQARGPSYSLLEGEDLALFVSQELLTVAQLRDSN